MHIANLKELITEYQSRKGLLVWETRNKKIIAVKGMSDTHLLNTIKMLECKEEEWYDNLLEGLTMDDIC